MVRKTRIALMSYTMDNRSSGSALYTRKLIEHLVARDDLECFLVHYEQTRDPLYTYATEIIMPRVQLPFASHFFSQMFFFWKYRNQPFDIIHWFQPRLYPFFWFAPAKHKVLTAHGAGDITAPASFIVSKFLFNFVLRFGNRTLDAIIAVSSFARQEIIEHYRTDPKKTYAISLGGGEQRKQPDESDILVVKNRHHIPHTYFLAVARHVPHKNIYGLIEAYDLVRCDPSRKEMLVIVGSFSSSYTANLERRNRSPFINDIVFIPHVSDQELLALYAGAILVVVPSHNEGFGLPVIEAFASGTPVVASNTTALPEVAGDAALLVNATDPLLLAKAILRIAHDKALAHRLIEKGYERSRRYTWKRMVEETVALYHSLNSAH